MRWSERTLAGLGIGSVVGCVGYTIWSMVTEAQIAGFLIRMQAYADHGRYGVNYSWVMTLFITVGLLGAPLATLALVRSTLIGTRPPSTLRGAARKRRLTILVPSLVVFGLSTAMAVFLLTETYEAAESLGWFTKLALFALPTSLLSWVPVAEALAPAGWHQGHVTARGMNDLPDGQRTYNIVVDGRSYAVSMLDHARATEGTLVGVLHTGGLLRLTIAVHTDLAELGGPPTAF